MSTRSLDSAPLGAVLLWGASIAAGLCGLGLAYCFGEPVVAESTVRLTFIVAFALFALSRLAMLVPLSLAGPRLARWALDYIILTIAGLWWILEPQNERHILLAVTLWIVLVAGYASLRFGIAALVQGLTIHAIGSGVRRLFVGAFVVCLLGGVVLSLPVCWQEVYPYQQGDPKSGEYLAAHFLNCCFTAAAALSGTGLSVLDIGLEFSRFGQLVIIGLMQLGGMVVLMIGAAVGWRFRIGAGWGSSDDDNSPTGVRRVIRFVITAMILFELLGAAAIYGMWQPDVDSNFDLEQRRPGLLLEAMQTNETVKNAIYAIPVLREGIDEPRLIYSLFHAVSAFTNCGLTLPRNGMIDYRGCWALYSVLLPLMLLGSLGGPVLYELWRRVRGRGGKRWRKLSTETTATLFATLCIVVIGGTVLFGIESARPWQNRYPPGNRTRLSVDQLEPPPEMITFSSEDSERVQSQRLATMPARERWVASVYQIVGARGAAMRTVRVDEDSLSPASRLWMMCATLVGGGLGGSSGGLRILLVMLLAQTALTIRRWAWVNSVNQVEARLRLLRSSTDSSIADELRLAAQANTGHQAIATAGTVVAAMFALIGGLTFVLLFREAGSFEACFAEAVNACCNAGFSTGLTERLSISGRIAVIIGMIVGKLLPLAILMRYLHDPSADPPARYFLPKEVWRGDAPPATDRRPDES